MAFSNSILSGVTLAREAIESEGFQTGVTGWRVDRDGDAEFNNLIARGEITAASVSVENPNDNTHRTTIKPSDPTDLSGGAGIPEIRQQYFGDDRVRIGAQGSSDGNVILGVDNSLNEFFTWMRGSSTSGKLRVGKRTNSTNFDDNLNDYGEVIFRTSGFVIEHQNGDEVVQLNPTAGDVTVNGDSLQSVSGKMSNTATQGGIATGTVTTVQFNQIIHVKNITADPSNERFVITKAGVYHLSLYVRANITAGVRVQVGIQKNGTPIVVNDSPATSGTGGLNVSQTEQLAVGDVITGTFFQATGATVSLAAPAFGAPSLTATRICEI